MKMLHDVELVRSIVRDKRVIPRHLHLAPTNRCNMECPWCCTRNRNRLDELPLTDIDRIVSDAATEGCRAVTLSGLGEPLVHRDIAEVIGLCRNAGLAVGVVTNGLRLDRLLDGSTWCRISFGSHRRIADEWESLSEQVRRLPNVTWSFNYVLDGCPDDLKRVVEFAVEHGFSLVRIVPNLFDLPAWSENRATAEAMLRGMDGPVLYQTWPQATLGAKRCWVSLLKPTVFADGRFVPCCAVEFGGRGRRTDLGWPAGSTLGEMVARQECFDGSQCKTCYYDNYNRLIEGLMMEIDHAEWL